MLDTVFILGSIRSSIFSEFCNKVDLMNNHSVENKRRKQALLYSDNFKTETQEEANKLDNYFDYVTMNLKPILR